MEMLFLFSVSCSTLNDPCERACGNAFILMDQPTGQLQTTNNNKEMKTMQFFYRAIRTRTVDLLGKTDQTDYYRNDSNCFKDPTCIFLHWALLLTDINIS